MTHLPLTQRCAEWVETLTGEAIQPRYWVMDIFCSENRVSYEIGLPQYEGKKPTTPPKPKLSTKCI